MASSVIFAVVEEGTVNRLRKKLLRLCHGHEVEALRRSGRILCVAAAVGGATSRLSVPEMLATQYSRASAAPASANSLCRGVERKRPGVCQFRGEASSPPK